MLAMLAATAAYIEAVVTVELTVDPDGKITACTVLESNAPAAEMNDLTCQGLLQGGRFAGAADGSPMPAKQVVTVRYRVPVGNAGE